MPHATTNGDKPTSQFITHLTSLPAVNDGIETVKSNPYGKKSLEIVDDVYTRFGKPVEPYLETPYSYAKPYLQKADELADSGLSRVETHFPIVTKDTNTIIDTGRSYIFWPYKYVTSTYSDEYSKTAAHNDRGKGVVTSVLALVSTELKIASDFFQTVADFLGPRYQEGKKVGSDYVDGLRDTASAYAKAGQEKIAGLQKAGEDKAKQAKGEASKAADSAKTEASKTADSAKTEANKVKDEAQKKASK